MPLNSMAEEEVALDSDDNGTKAQLSLALSPSLLTSPAPPPTPPTPTPLVFSLQLTSCTVDPALKNLSLSLFFLSPPLSFNRLSQDPM